jgi:hypothetical protein
MSARTTLSDHRLLTELHELVRKTRTQEAQLLRHLGEVDKRRLFLREACSSMFRYCVSVLHFSEASAFKRIAAARAAREFPEIFEAIARGELHVTAVRLLAPHLNRENAAELIALAKHRTADEIKRRLADRNPKPDVAASIRRVAWAAPAANTPCTPPVDTPSRSVAPPLIPAAPPSPSKAEPLGGERYSIRFSANPQTHAQLRELQALLRHKIPNGDLGAILGHAIAVLHKQVRKQKFADCKKPRSRVEKKSESSLPCKRPASTRAIPAALRRAVAKRDKERCTYVSPSGRHCNTRDFLEFHHKVPWGRDSSHQLDNITLRCRAHNLYAAGQDYGHQHMAKFSKTLNANAAGREVPRVSDERPGQLDLSPVR